MSEPFVENVKYRRTQPLQAFRIGSWYVACFSNCWRGVMNRDELDGKATKAKGKIKEAAGDLTGNDRLRGEGAADQAIGKTQETFGKAKRKVGEALDDLSDDMKR
jgi:uncharacterized protein YjbJ (UPF0337 family)